MLQTWNEHDGGAIPPDPSPDGPIEVLLVEDNVGFAYGVRDMLIRQSGAPFTVTHVGTLADALAVFSGRRVDVVLLDLGLPDSMRIETFARLREQARATPIIILTVLDDDEVALEAMRTGAQDYLVKDRVDMHLLVRAIKYALERVRIGTALRDLSGRLIRLQDEERRRIARDIHDATAQGLAALSMNLSALQEKEPNLRAESRRLLQVCLECVSQCAKDLRTTTYLLHPPLLDNLGLAGAVRDFADGFAARSGIRVDLEMPADMKRLSRETELTLFRVMQESLTNTHRHSGSRTASIRLTLAETGVTLEVSDAGRGFGTGARSAGTGARAVLPGVGIAGMRERVRQLRGRFDISSGTQGTTVRATLPIATDTP